MTQQGPTTVTSNTRVCGLCRFHRQHMVMSGEHPEYKHFCGHPAASLGLKYSYILFPDEHGREIGDTDNTPEWCPVVAERIGAAPDDSVHHGCNPFAPEALRGQPPEVIANLQSGIPQPPASGRAQQPEGGEGEDGPEKVFVPLDIIPDALIGELLLKSEPNHDSLCIEARDRLAKLSRELKGARLVLELIDILRGDPGSGDGVIICCANDEPEDKDDREQVVCCSAWTGWKEFGFNGETLLEALQKAAAAKGGANV